MTKFLGPAIRDIHLTEMARARNESGIHDPEHEDYPPVAPILKAFYEPGLLSAELDKRVKEDLFEGFVFDDRCKSPEDHEDRLCKFILAKENGGIDNWNFLLQQHKNAAGILVACEQYETREMA